jgi:hypothetical protein
MGGDEFAGGDMDVEDKVENLEDELEDLRSDFERMVADLEGGDDMGDGDEVDMDMDSEMDMGDGEFGAEDELGGEEEFETESVEYDLDEAEEVDEDDLEEDDALEEATKLQDTSKLQHKGKVGGLPGSEDDTATAMNMAKPTVVGNGNTGPVSSTDGSDGKKGDSASKNATTDNIDVDHKASKIDHGKGSKMPDSADAGGNKAALIPKKLR